MRTVRLVVAWAVAQACQCGPPLTLRLSGPDLVQRGATARFSVSVVDAEGRPGAGAAGLMSDVGSLRDGTEVVLDETGTTSVTFTCAPDDDPGCTGAEALLEAWWKGQRVEKRVRLVDELPTIGFGGGSAGGGSAQAGGFTSAGGSAAGGATAGGTATTIADGGACDDADGGLSSLGCEFLVAPVPPENTTRGSCWAVVLANGGSQTVEVRVERGGSRMPTTTWAQLLTANNLGQPVYTPLRTSGSAALLPPDQVAVLFLADERASGSLYVGCPVPAAITHPFQVSGTAVMQAFRISTSGPVAAFDIYPYGGARSAVASASLLLPTTSWGTTSVGVTPAPQLGTLHPYLQIYAIEDTTDLRIEAPVDIVGAGRVPGSVARQVVPRTLHRGEVLQLQQPEELGGAIVRSSRPVAVWGGHACMMVPTGTWACDSAHQQVPPVAHLGTEYVAVRPPSRSAGDEDALWRFVGTTAGTALTYLPAVPGAPPMLAAGQVVEFRAPGPFVVRSQDPQHPFLATQLMRGATGVPGTLGDPDFVLLVPPGQYLSSYLFFTDHTYANTHLVFVRRAVGSSFADVTLDCGGPLTWRPLVDPRFQYATRSWTRAGSNGCANGIHRASSAEPFGLTVWGTDSFVSYAYPAGMGVNRLNAVDPDPIQ